MSTQKNILVILDLDHTVIEACINHGEELEKINDAKANFKQPEEEYHTLEDDEDAKNNYVIVERRGSGVKTDECYNLQSFLTFLFNSVDVAVWTAASKDYAGFIVDKIILKDPSRDLKYFLWHQHCSKSRKDAGGISKSINKLSEWSDDFKRYECIVILDDNYLDVIKDQKDMSILVKEFHCNKEDTVQEFDNKCMLKLMSEYIGQIIHNTSKDTISSINTNNESCEFYVKQTES